MGDIAWSGGLAPSKALLDTLVVPYVPIMGDNEIQGGSEEGFADTYAPQLDLLSATFDDWSEAPRPVDNPEIDGQSWLWNYGFSYRGLRFLALDWCAREIGTIFGEMADLHDFDGGTAGWFQDQVLSAGDGPIDRLVMASHHPMHLSPGAFDLAEMETLEAFTALQADTLAADYAGHYHSNGEELDRDGGYDVFVTDATHEDEVTVRVVTVSGNGLRFAYAQELVALPYDE